MFKDANSVPVTSAPPSVEFILYSRETNVVIASLRSTHENIEILNRILTAHYPPWDCVPEFYCRITYSDSPL